VTAQQVEEKEKLGKQIQQSLLENSKMEKELSYLRQQMEHTEENVRKREQVHEQLKQQM
jgi:hypothetical protein